MRHFNREDMVREANWSEAVAVGSLSFVNQLKGELGFKAAHRAALRPDPRPRGRAVSYMPNMTRKKVAVCSRHRIFLRRCFSATNWPSKHVADAFYAILHR
jgi:hypothetical protein